jgi:uncharacterized phiE125 gp8 family phage protein
MGLKLITAPTLEPITVAELKAQCRIDTADEDALLAVIIAAARAKAESYTGAAIMQQTWEQALDGFPCAEIEVLKPAAWSGSSTAANPFTLTSISYLDEAGATQTLGNTLYVADVGTFPSWVLPKFDTSWPATSGAANSVTLRYTVGYTVPTLVPGDMRAWLLLTAAYLYAQREAMVTIDRVAEIPARFVDSLIDPYRVFKV